MVVGSEGNRKRVMVKLKWREVVPGESRSYHFEFSFRR
jgi:hypothetical protein